MYMKSYYKGTAIEIHSTKQKKSNGEADKNTDENKWKLYKHLNYEIHKNYCLNTFSLATTRIKQLMEVAKHRQADSEIFPKVSKLRI